MATRKLSFDYSRDDLIKEFSLMTMSLRAARALRVLLAPFLQGDWPLSAFTS